MPRTRTSRPRRPRALVLLTALIAAAALVVPTTGASAAKPGSPTSTPSPDRIDLQLTGLDLPLAPGSPDLLISAAEDFSLTVSFMAGMEAVPYSAKTATDVLVTDNAGKTLTTARVPAGVATETVRLRLSAANDVTLTAQAVGQKASSDLARGTAGPFDVVQTAVTQKVAQGRGIGVFVNAAGTAAPCQATALEKTCVDVLLPNGVNSNVFFSTGLCTGDVGCRSDSRQVLQVLADLKDKLGNALYTETAPATLIVKCDKTLCQGGSIRQDPLLVNLDPPYADPPYADPLRPRALLAPSPACGAKGIMDGPKGHCVDYVQSKRDGSGDTHLYLLITRDARQSH